MHIYPPPSAWRVNLSHIFVEIPWAWRIPSPPLHGRTLLPLPNTDRHVRKNEGRKANPPGCTLRPSSLFCRKNCLSGVESQRGFLRRGLGLALARHVFGAGETHAHRL
jgi:hypothetical protein